MYRSQKACDERYWILGDNDYATARELIMKRGDMGAVWRGDEEEEAGKAI